MLSRCAKVSIIISLFITLINLFYELVFIKKIKPNEVIGQLIKYRYSNTNQSSLSLKLQKSHTYIKYNHNLTITCK